MSSGRASVQHVRGAIGSAVCVVYICLLKDIRGFLATLAARVLAHSGNLRHKGGATGRIPFCVTAHYSRPTARRACVFVFFAEAPNGCLHGFPPKTSEPGGCQALDDPVV